ncbi:Selenide [Durusdinium trenchii]|uniref:Water dikinase (Selenium donor protein) (Selenophosphate synthase) n=1 Tax=Durusdinium trenchii TaxID=1381693 RepID=A0ABP0J333_9DINO
MGAAKLQLMESRSLLALADPMRMLVSDDIAIVGTLDFFTPIVDEPEVFGGIAAANALSDVYAMGAKPIFAMNIVGFPSNRLPPSVLARILKGGQEKCAEAKVSILGGHTVEDLEPKYGLAVIGVVHPKKVWRNNALRAGDSLILTKPIGTGILGTAQKKGLLEPGTRKQLEDTLLQLNKTAAEVAHAEAEVHAATDVTGFGLLGHLKEMLTPEDSEPAAKRARQGNGESRFLCAVISAQAVPLLPQAKDLAGNDQCVPGGSLNNLKLVEPTTCFPKGISREMKLLLADAQTSGGLLLAVPGDGSKLVAALQKAGLPRTARIGEVREATQGATIVVEP